MTGACHRLLDALPRGELPPDLRAHAEGCPACRAAREAYQALASGSPALPSPRLGSQLAAELEAAAAPAARWWSWPLGLGAVNGLMAVLGVLLLGRRGLVLNPAQPGALAAVAALIAACAVLGTFFATAPGFGRARKAAAGVALLTAGAVALGGAGLPGARSLWGGGWPCMGVEAAMTALPLLAALWIQRRFAFDPLRSLLASLAAGAAGLFALHLHCPVGTAQHLLLFHLAPWAGLGALGLWARSRLPTRSYAP